MWVDKTKGSGWLPFVFMFVACCIVLQAYLALKAFFLAYLVLKESFRVTVRLKTGAPGLEAWQSGVK